ALVSMIQEVMDENPDQVATYRDGNHNVLGWFIGQVMQKSRGQANPQAVNELLREMLGADQE
ncbi:MAG: Asp-tRNA(Asn)/Glu-tRNA(Gln) amidotransferase subunit GatB, partial [Myxococcota bacterium]